MVLESSGIILASFNLIPKLSNSHAIQLILESFVLPDKISSPIIIIPAEATIKKSLIKINIVRRYL